MSSLVNKNFGSTQYNNNQGGTQYNFDHGNVTINNTSSPESVLKELKPHVATNALHNAKTRANRHACSEGTRGGFIEDLGQWIEGHRGDGHVFWVKAGAGVGKTAVAQTLCEKYCRTENSTGLLAAAHFFSRNDSTRNSMDRFVPTIAYQLARLHPHLADAIDTAIHSDPNIMGADWEDQFKRLVCEPCNRVDSELWETLPRLVIIDGLDECMDIREPQMTNQKHHAWERNGQKRLLSMIRDSVTAPSPLPLRFLIFSRPEHTISNFLHTDSFPDLVETDMRELRLEADSDIHLYLRQEFARLVSERRDAGPIDASWPGEEALQELTRMSDGLFIYVVTAVKYVMDEGPSSHPRERLDIILQPKPSKYPDLEPLDRLYLQILQPFVDIREQLLPLLQLIITDPAGLVENAYSKKGYILTGDIERFLDLYWTYRSRRVLAELMNQVDSQHISIILSRLRSVLYIPDDEHSEDVSVLHASFSDFLSDKRRSNDFHVEYIRPQRYLEKVLLSSSRVLKRIILRYTKEEPREPPMVEAWALTAWAVSVDGFDSVGEIGELLHAFDDLDVYCFVNIINDGDYLQTLQAYTDIKLGQFIADSLLGLSQAYARVTGPRRIVNNIARTKWRHNKNGPFFQFFEEDCVAVLPKQYREICYLKLKLLIGSLWGSRGSKEKRNYFCGDDFSFYNGDKSLKIFPHDVPPSILAQSMAIEDCEIWRFGRGPCGTFKFRQATIAPTGSRGHIGWVPLSRAESSDMYRWMDDFARTQSPFWRITKRARPVPVSFRRTKFRSNPKGTEFNLKSILSDQNASASSYFNFEVPGADGTRTPVNRDPVV